MREYRAVRTLLPRPALLLPPLLMLLAAAGAQAEVVSEWSSGQPGAPRAQHVSWAWDKALIVAGGSAGGVALASVQSAALDAAGAPGAFTDGPALPAARTRACAALSEAATGTAARPTLYLIGGVDGAGVVRAEIFRATLGADSRPGAWTQAGALPAPRADHGCAFALGRVWVAGGSTDGAGSAGASDVLVGDGASAWAKSSLPGAVGPALVAASGSGLFVFGQAAAFQAKVDKAATAPSWSAAPLLPEAPGAALVSYAGRLIAAGGASSGNLAGTVRAAEVTSTSALGPWTAQRRPARAVSGASAAVAVGRLYLTGGVDASNVDTGDVTSARLAEASGVPVSLSFTGQPAQVVAVGEAFTAEVTLLDSAGAVADATAAVTLQLQAPAGTTLSGKLTVDAASGVAKFSGLTVDTTADATGAEPLTGVVVVVSAPGLTSATSWQLTVYRPFDTTAPAALGFGCSGGGERTGLAALLLVLLFFGRRVRRQRIIHVFLLISLSALGPEARAQAPAPAPARGKLTPEELAHAKAANMEGQNQLVVGNYEGAIAAFERALTIVRSPSVLYTLADTHRLAGHKEAAAEKYREYLVLAPKGPKAAEAAQMYTQLTGNPAPVAAVVAPPPGPSPVVAAPAPAPPAAALAPAASPLPEPARPAVPAPPAAAIPEATQPTPSAVKPGKPARPGKGDRQKAATASAAPAPAAPAHATAPTHAPAPAHAAAPPPIAAPPATTAPAQRDPVAAVAAGRAAPCDPARPGAAPCTSRLLVDGLLSSAPAQKTVGGELLVGYRFGRFDTDWTLALGVALAQRPGALLQFGHTLYASAPQAGADQHRAFSLGAALRARVSPLTGGLAVGGGAGLQARMWLGGPLTALASAAFEAVHAPAGTAVAPLLLVGLRLDL